MTATTYSELVADIQAFVDNDLPELQDELPRMISWGHARIQRDLELSIWRGYEQKHLPWAQDRIDKPADAMKIYSIQDLDTGLFIERRSTDYVRSYGLGVMGTTRYFAEDSEGQLLLAPMPDRNRPVMFSYLKRLDPPSSTNENTYITDNFGDMLLYASLIHAEEWLIGAERKGEFQAEYDRLLQEYRNELRGLHNEEYAPIRQSAIVRGLT